MAIVNKCVQFGPLAFWRPINYEFHKIFSQTASLFLFNDRKECYPGLCGSVIVRWKMPKISKIRGTLGVRRCRVKGMFREDGEWVSAGTILVKQLGLLYFPGLNVGLGRNRNLFAMEHGYVMITTEKARPNWDQAVLQLFYGQYAETDTPIYKTYFHVIPAPMPQTFKLTHQI